MWFLFLIVLLIAYEFIQISFQSFSSRLESQANQRLIDKADGNLDLLEASFAKGELQKTRGILKQLSQGERVVCLSLILGDKIVSFPEVCDVKNSDATLSISSKSGATLKIETSQSFGDELMGIIRTAFLGLILAVSIFGMLPFLKFRNE